MKTWQRLKQRPSLMKQYLMRERVIDAIRLFFKKQGFHEVETPLLVQSPGTEPYLEVFETTLKSPGSKDKQGFLLTSPEYAMKKLLAAGMGNIFQVGKSFRNQEGVSSRHNPEFTILEWYRTEADYLDIMADFEQMMLFILRSVTDQKTKLVFQGRSYNLTPPYPRMTVAEAFKKYVGVTSEQMLSRQELIKVARHKQYEVKKDSTWEEVYNQLFLNEIEPQLAKFDRPIFIYDYPVSQAALSKVKSDDPRFAERFEVYLAGLELGNAFSELVDATEQERRLKAELALRKKLGKVEFQLDIDFIEALKSGLPDTGGIAVGIDRLVMLFANATSIQDTLFFPAQEIFE